ncbi:MAG: 1-acyl-sn-glycerol-3-phosphate acyltransferase [Acidobacteria bacterium]|nr:1-acyl-sn-glycerol-3-phosphate acyltransferase [Acidobacteriota bacterium]MCB9398514.1 1-acyl-sn-glycerol-3-phosphate acyltransferase [Acidobacteriota bacterium]
MQATMLSPLHTSLTWRGIWSRELVDLSLPVDRWVCKSLCWLAKNWIVEIEGNLDALQNDPQILVMNHSNRLETLLLPAVFCFLRHGRRVHFMADWHLSLVPLLRGILMRNGAIVVSSKPHRIQWLNRFRPQGSAYKVAQDRLQNGRSVALFPEGKMNRNPHQLLKGRQGAAFLACQTGCPILPIGIQFPGIHAGPIGDFNRMRLHIGPSLPAPQDPTQLNSHHQAIMTRISELSGKSWHPNSQGGVHAG